MRADPTEIFGTTTDKYMRFSMLFNTNAIRLDSGVESKGIDIVGYNLAATTWDTQSFACITS